MIARTEQIKAGIEQFALTFINLLILFEIRMNCLRSGRRRSFYLFIRRAIKQNVIIIEATAYKILSSILLSRLTTQAEEIVGDHPCGYRRNSSTTAFVKFLQKNWGKMKQYISYL
jgi:hypothetical protein